MRLAGAPRAVALSVLQDVLAAGGAGTLAFVSVTIALVGDRNPDHPSHRELDAVREMLGDGVAAAWVATDDVRVRDLAEFATAADAGAEVIELTVNRFYMLTLFQPHIGALAGKPLHPLLREFVRCARAYAQSRGGGAPAAGAAAVRN